MQGDGAIWEGCQAGMNTLGIEANGVIKGCPSLPTAAYTGGNIRETPLRKILSTAELTFNARQGTAAASEHLWGFCRTCQYAELCRGGCSWTAHVFFGQRGNNPYCHHRALVHQKQGLRERLTLATPASGEPFDHGKFAITMEPVDAPWPESDSLHFTKECIHWNRISAPAPGLFPILN